MIPDGKIDKESLSEYNKDDETQTESEAPTQEDFDVYGYHAAIAGVDVLPEDERERTMNLD